MALDIDISKIDARTYRVKLTGMLDTETTSQLDHRMKEVLADADARAIRMELQGLTYISSLGLGIVATIKKAIAAKGGVMVIVGAQPQITRVFDIVKMLPKETVFTTREEADAYLAAIQKNVIEERRQGNPGSGNAG